MSRRPLRPTTAAKRRVSESQYTKGYAAGAKWGSRLRPLAAPVRWWRKRSRATR